MPVVISLLALSTIVSACDLGWTVRPADDPVLDGSVSVDVRTSDATLPEHVPSDARDEERADASADADASDDATGDAAATDADADADADTTCSEAKPCSSTSYCDYGDDFCGSASPTGLCRPRPASCADAALEPVCGCGGATYTSSCAAAAAGKDVSLQACTSSPPSSHKCGYRFCDDKEPCLITGVGVKAVYACGTANSCALCLCALACLGGTCGTEDGHIILRCP